MHLPAPLPEGRKQGRFVETGDEGQRHVWRAYSLSAFSPSSPQPPTARQLSAPRSATWKHGASLYWLRGAAYELGERRFRERVLPGMDFRDRPTALCHPVHRGTTASGPRRSGSRRGSVFSEGLSLITCSIPGARVGTAARPDLQRPNAPRCFLGWRGKPGKGSTWTQSLANRGTDRAAPLLSARITHAGRALRSSVPSDHTRHTGASGCRHNLFQKVTMTFRIYIYYKRLYTLYMHFKIGNHC